MTACVCALTSALSAAETSQVVRLNIESLLDQQHDVELVLHHRSDGFHHGYAIVPQRDNITHRIDLTPSRAIAFEDKDGNKIDVPREMQGKYSLQAA